MANYSPSALLYCSAQRPSSRTAALLHTVQQGSARHIFALLCHVQRSIPILKPRVGNHPHTEQQGCALNSFVLFCMERCSFPNHVFKCFLVTVLNSPCVHVVIIVRLPLEFKTVAGTDSNAICPRRSTVCCILETRPR